MPRIKKEYTYPIYMIILVVTASTYLSYGHAKGPWYKVIYPDDRDAFAEASHYADAIAEQDSLGPIIFIENPFNAKALEASGAILLDPKGVPLCLSQ